jgi:hypothetical protein
MRQFLEKLIFPQLISRAVPRDLEPERLLPLSQERGTSPYPDESNTCPLIMIL